MVTSWNKSRLVCKQLPLRHKLGHKNILHLYPGCRLVNGIILHAIVGRRAAPIDNNGTNQQPLHER
jgi:hypothetical protein